MTIRAKLLINVLSLAGSLLIIAIVLNIVGNKIVESTDKGYLADNIVVGISDMNMITYDYLMNPNERTKQQWELKHASLEALIKGAKFETEEESVIIRRIMANHGDTALFFKQLLENNEKKKNASSAIQTLLDESNQRYVTQLMARSHNMISDAYALGRASDMRIQNVQSWSFWLIVAAMVIMTTAASATSFYLSRNIDASIQTLTRGTEIIARGDLDYKVPVKGQDEIASLSLAFNEMTDRLRTSYSSLAKEIEEKEKAQEALQQAHDDLELRVEERTKELSLSEQKISQILSSITDSYYSLDREWRVIAINDQALQYFGMTREDILNKIWWDIIPAGLGSIIEIQYKRAISEGIPVHFDVESLIANRWAEVHAYPSDEGLSVYFKDITDRKQAEAETTRLASFPRLNPSPIVEVDPSGQVFFCNPAAEELFPDIFQRGREHPWLSDWESLVGIVQKSSTKRASRETHIGDRWYLQTIHFVEDTQRLRIYGLDITERKHAEEALVERTSQLEAANRELDSFSYSVSHDLRAPLRAIDGFSKMILDDTKSQLDEETRRRFDIVRKNIRTMGQLIDDLLAFSRLGRAEMRLSEIDMTSLVKSVTNELMPKDVGRKIEIKIDELLPARGDRTLIQQVMVNLLSNAIKYTKVKEEAVIQVGGYEDGVDNAYYVRDNGAGFDMKYYDKLFGVFQRLHSASEYEGTGVGLANVQRIITRHGGRVWAEGKIDEGACFYFTLPRKELIL